MGLRYRSNLSLISVVEGSGWSASRTVRSAPANDSVLIVYEAGWAPEPFWTCAEKLAPTRILSPDRPAGSETLYRLSCSGPRLSWLGIEYSRAF